ncbi:polysialyltransferase family glycosyltransferase [Streptomyces sp. NPDC049970]|uniref:polysialyltransferase family glycosyltransferase n=1 Tax=Streptomyces sp. NPDC049970 TaxID=3155033 RepID=UPI003416CFD4
MNTQVFLATTVHGTAVLAAALDAGCFGPAGRRVLLLAESTAIPEAAPPVDSAPGFGRLRDRFDEVLSWNDAVFPLHPGGWTPRADDVPLWERHLRRLWALGDDGVELVLPAPDSAPALAVAQVFTGSPITVYADGLNAYGPTGGKLDPLIGTRVRELLHPDLLPGLKPLLLGEFGVALRPLPAAALLKVWGELADAAPDVSAPEGAVLLLLSGAGALPDAEEADLQLRMIRDTAALGHTRLVLQPHPGTPASRTRALRAEAARLGVEMTVAGQGPAGAPVLAEVLHERLRPALVVGSFSTALLTAATFYGLPVARTGTGTLLERLTPYEIPARMPVTITDALLPGLGEPGAAEGTRPDGAAVAKALGGLVEAVAFAMQPRVRPDLRPAAERYLSDHLDSRTWRYFRRRRLGTLALPGVVPARLAFVRRNATLRRLARRARALRRR